MNINDYLKQMQEKRASDLYFKVEGPPYYRIDNRLMPAGDVKLGVLDIEKVISGILTAKQQEIFSRDKELDGAYSLQGVGRFRFNIYVQKNTPAITFRYINAYTPSFEELNLPVEVMKKLSSQPRGLILVTGYAGSGKSTTLAAMIDYINKNSQKHIITIEDPVEFVHSDKKSIISQREVGSDTNNFSDALRHVIRQSPDIIFIGEMRDELTMRIAIMAAETGHLVLSTLHTIDTIQTVDRIINFFPPYAHDQIRLQLSLLLKGIVSMRLIPRIDKPGRVPACEIMLSTPTVKKAIAQGKTEELAAALEEGKLFGMQSFNQSIIEWLNKSVISKELALEYASNADELNLKLQDILPGGGNTVEF